MESGKPYRPSNGSEGKWFEEDHCQQCINDNPHLDGKKKCEIVLMAIFHTIGEPEYPKEWIYGEDGKPTCTSFVKWDWGNNGDPDDPDNPNYRPPDNPNQLCFPFLFEEIGCETIREEEMGLVNQ